MARCAQCKWDYPSDILAVIHGPQTDGPVCGICALDIINGVHGFGRIAFEPGSKAESMRLAAAEHRRLHPESAPPAGGNWRGGK